MQAEVPVFDDRLQAGKVLAKHLIGYRAKKNVVVLAVSKEGVEVAFAIAQALRAGMDLVISHLLLVPQYPETAFGAITEDVVLLNDGLVSHWNLDRSVIRDLARDAQDIAKHEMLSLRGHADPPNVANKIVIITDDGMSAGFPIISAVVWARRANASKVIVALPVSPAFEVHRLQQLVDQVVCPVTPDSWGARIATFYRTWRAPTDAEVKSLLAAARKPQGD